MPAHGSENPPHTYTVPGINSPTTGDPLPVTVSYKPELLPDGIVGERYNAKIEVFVDGAGCTCVFQGGPPNLPPGLTLRNSVGDVQQGDTYIELSGIPTKAGKWAITTQLFVPNFAQRVNACCPANWDFTIDANGKEARYRQAVEKADKYLHSTQFVIDEMAKDLARRKAEDAVIAANNVNATAASALKFLETTFRASRAERADIAAAESDFTKTIDAVSGVEMRMSVIEADDFRPADYAPELDAAQADLRNAAGLLDKVM